MKVKVHPLTYILIFSILLCGYFNYFLIISFILFFHDLGHLIMMKIFKIRVISIELLPFGSIMNTNINYNLNSNMLLIISFGGILVQLLLYLIFGLLDKLLIINDLSYRIFLTYNELIILFNLLPIVPLDGSKILLSIIERFLPYKFCLIIINFFSLLFIVIFVLVNDISLNLILIVSFLLCKTFTEILNHKYIYNKFLLERYLYKVSFKKIVSINNIKKMFKNRFNFINGENEDKILVKMFDNP